ncbi:CDP-glycerol glycerophosphotransferase family protein [Salipaludibacillus agaradhaerens]|uniref:CDP-glycerol glycerophosphotransferase family protein n=1 Tax=Salipaludibacillus agaradhaerens TaxID=76935 RepID=A0A9Q4B0T4_SALAG|nr:CDP-glycerol glycerophosphotransferase family protein [Salipaludibacillus agaradhaerens]MCR6096278.1 CDP-glycerol glycerophosphotransferase family protein [Salipaludibacillus agaradhaerens]MCR6114163.1 CDP-glycerol glycerophosphotransferase family protein [Salipaludibacillus agaradhaerens]
MKELIKRTILHFLMTFFSVFKVKKSKLLFMSYYGGQYSCNPKYITEYLLKHDLHKKFEIVWVLNKPEQDRNKPFFRTAKAMSLRYFYHLATAQVVITNHRLPNHFKKKDDQYYIQTWHSSLRLKQIEKDAGKALPDNYIELAKHDSHMCNLLLSGCAKSTEIFKRSFWYEGEILESGTPRNDILVTPQLDLVNRVKLKLNLSPEKKVVLFAPTFRNKQKTTPLEFDVDRILTTLKQAFGGEWVLLVKLHPHLTEMYRHTDFSKNVRNVTAYEDTQELLACADILITDYSSLMFDFAITERPCFLYTPDIEQYTASERKLYFQLSDLPFPSAVNEEELLVQFDRFNKQDYLEKLATFLLATGSFEEGKASEKVVERIHQICS